ncbi:class I SAM-dependent methyltransferase [Nocardioides sp. WS12]|uniref:class I SAM-dependent methyltransferase n=1 Tax=Nocardioides sp. WS12 TaxID=2486272 RepID=UPI0015F8DC56|nr:class I SAM-dependent methyltransferase [Nocardioides sp. WS12]
MTAIGSAYDLSAAAWRSGPAALYARLAGAMLDDAQFPLAGATVLDAGAGTGVAGEQAAARGAARVVAVDLAPRMLPRPPALSVGGDLLRLPFRDGSFDVAVAAFSLGHAPDPVQALAELRRVARSLAASAFPVGWTHVAKNVVESALVERGYRAPDWYVAFKNSAEARVGDPDRLAGLASAAGYASAGVGRIDVDGGLTTPAEMVAWRMGMAHTAPFVAGLSSAARADLTAEVEAALVGAPAVVVPMLVLSAQ